MAEETSLNKMIGKSIRNARKSAGLTQEQFGILIPMDDKNVSKIERGVAGISVQTLKRICEVLSVSSDSLLFGGKSENPVDDLADRLRQLPPEDFEIAKETLNTLFKEFAQKAALRKQ